MDESLPRMNVHMQHYTANGWDTPFLLSCNHRSRVYDIILAYHPDRFQVTVSLPSPAYSNAIALPLEAVTPAWYVGNKVRNSSSPWISESIHARFDQLGFELAVLTRDGLLAEVEPDANIIEHDYINMLCDYLPDWIRLHDGGYSLVYPRLAKTLKERIDALYERRKTMAELEQEYGPFPDLEATLKKDGWNF